MLPMANKDIPWKLATDKKVRRNLHTEEMVCTCGNKLLRVLKEPILRKERTLTSPDLRVAVECPLCGSVARIKRGGPN
jgi:hypothetical protein